MGGKPSVGAINVIVVMIIIIIMIEEAMGPPRRHLFGPSLSLTAFFIPVMTMVMIGEWCKTKYEHLSGDDYEDDHDDSEDDQ